MIRLLRALASLRLTLAGFAFVAAGAWIAHDDDAASAAWVVAPLALVAANLAAALATRRALRRGGLGVFHAALLALIVVAAFGRLCRFEGRVEIAQGQSLDVAAIEVLTRGPLHRDRLGEAAFVQGPFRVDYSPGIRRDHTHSEVAVPEPDGRARIATVGDDTPLVLAGYRFYTTHNKGWAPVLAWLPAHGPAQTGPLHLPSWPLFDWKQENRFTPAGGPEIRVFLRPGRAPDAEAAWTFDPDAAPATLSVHAGGREVELAPGDSMHLAGGTLRFERMTGWMGYRVFFDPTLPWLLVLATLAASGLGWHLWRRERCDGAAHGSRATQPHRPHRAGVPA